MGTTSESNLQLAQNYFSTRWLTDSRKSSYRSAIRSYSRYVGEPLRDAYKSSLQKWFSEAIKDGLKVSTIVMYAFCLRILYRYSLQCRGLTKEVVDGKTSSILDSIPLKDLTREVSRRNNGRDKLVTPEEFKKLLLEAKRPRTKALLVVLYESGCRKGEILSLKIRDVTLGEKYTTIRVSGKTGERAIPLIKSVPYLRQWIQVHPDRNPDSPLFATVVKGQVVEASGGSVTTCLRRLCKRAGVRNIHAHMLRHTRLTELARQGLGEYQLKNFAGWRPDSRMAARYLHLTGRAHINAVLEVGGVSIEKEEREERPLFQMTVCPTCGGSIGGDMMFCPHCSLLLDENLQIERVEDMKALRKEVDDLRKLLKRTLDIAIGTPSSRINATK